MRNIIDMFKNIVKHIATMPNIDTMIEIVHRTIPHPVISQH